MQPTRRKAQRKQYLSAFLIIPQHYCRQPHKIYHFATAATRHQASGWEVIGLRPHAVMPFLAGRRAKPRAKGIQFIFLVAALALRYLFRNNTSRYSAVETTAQKIDNDHDDRPFVAIVSCITSSTDRFFYKSDQLLREKLLPSIYTTISHDELGKYRVEIIFGYDEGDVYWQQQSNQDVITNSFRDSPHHIPVDFVSLQKDKTRLNHIPFNELCQISYDRGAKYLVRINDDTHFISRGWLTLTINTLQSFSPPNIGVVGPICKGDASEDREILTHDMTYLPFHLAIFGTYYPDVFDNYYIDDWMSHVYSANRTRRLMGWEVMHNTQAFGTRYTPSFSQDQFLEEEVKKGREKVQSFIDANRFTFTEK